MKKPRVEDFDPNKTHKLASPMDDLPMIQPPEKNLKTTTNKAEIIEPIVKIIKKKQTEVINPTVKSIEPPPARTPVLPYVRTNVKRTITRYAFEFFQDQIETLRKFSLDEKIRGEKGSMSEMVREAIDMFISKKNLKDE